MSKEELVATFMQRQTKRKAEKAKKYARDYDRFKMEMVYKTKKDTRMGY